MCPSLLIFFFERFLFLVATLSGALKLIPVELKVDQRNMKVSNIHYGGKTHIYDVTKHMAYYRKSTGKNHFIKKRIKS